MTVPSDRRRFLHLAAVAGAGAALTACSVISSGGTSTVSIDVGKITTDGKAMIAAVAAVLAVPAVIALLGPADIIIAETALASAATALANIQTLTGGTIVLSADTTKVQALVTSLLADVQTALLLVQTVVGNLVGATATTVANSVAAALALIAFVQLAASLSSSHATSMMSEDHAVAAAYVVPR